MTQATMSRDKAEQATGFWLIHSSSDAGNSLIDALHALYYLPESFRLIIVSDDMQRDTLCTMGHIGLKNRVKIMQKTGTPQDDSPFLIADVVITDHKKHAGKKPLVLISEQVAEDIEDNEWSGYTVAAGNPAALATAIHNLARTAA